jgi:hypothetical protein
VGTGSPKKMRKKEIERFRGREKSQLESKHEGLESTHEGAESKAERSGLEPYSF